MALSRAYDEVVDFVATWTDAAELVAFRPSEESRARVEELIAQEKAGEISVDDRSELDHYLQLEHLLRLAKARSQARSAGFSPR